MAVFAALAEAISLTPHEALSGVFGSISLAAWIFLLVPQLIENYRLGSASGISLAFLLVWFLGDVTNLLGAIGASLVPTVVALAVYFCLADIVLIAQCLYYNLLNARRDRRAAAAAARKASTGSSTATRDSSDDVERPLLGRRPSDNIGLPGSRRRSSGGSRRRSQPGGRRESLAGIVEEGARGRGAWIKNSVSVVLVCLAGAAGWAVAWKSGAWRPAPAVEEPGRATPLWAEVLGYASAVCYLGARIPQIIKNQREKSCEGLSLLFFLLSLLGNATYGAGILFHSIEKEYFMRNLPWLIGSLGTMVEDAVIFLQFHLYGDTSPSVAIE